MERHSEGWTRPARVLNPKHARPGLGFRVYRLLDVESEVNDEPEEVLVNRLRFRQRRHHQHQRLPKVDASEIPLRPPFTQKLNHSKELWVDSKDLGGEGRGGHRAHSDRHVRQQPRVLHAGFDKCVDEGFEYVNEGLDGRNTCR